MASTIFLEFPSEPPVGQLRFRPPRPLKDPPTIFNATSPGLACPQPVDPIPFPKFSGIFSNVTRQGEDCLNLNIVRTSSVKGLLPVMVWIYGGNLIFGQANDQLYTPDFLVAQAAKSKDPVLHVAMNYRLNIFGFAASSALQEESPNSWGNAGLRDQRAALEWIQDNIEAFGGDKRRVTMFGQSAGGNSIGWQLTAYGGQSKDARKSLPFSGAIMQSGAALAPGIFPNALAAQPAFDAVARLVNCTETDGAQQLACVRKVSSEDLFTATQVYVHQTSPRAIFDPSWNAVVDGEFMPKPVSEREGRFAPVPLLAGWNELDGSVGTVGKTFNSTVDVASDLRQSFPGLTNSTINELFGALP